MDWGGPAAVRALRQAQAVSAYARRTGCGIGEAADALADRAGPAPDDTGRTSGDRPGDRAGKAYYAWSAGGPHTGGAYSYRKTGPYTGFNGIQGRRHGGLHFAGEHTSLNFQGYMEGALRSGDRCAAEISGG